MAEYDPTAALSFDEASGQADDGGSSSEQQEDGDVAEDDEYEPSSFSFPNGGSSEKKQQESKPKTIGGFVIDSDDEEEQDTMQEAARQSEGVESKHAGDSEVGAPYAPDVIPSAINSTPQEDTAAAVTPTVQITQSAHPNGSPHLVSAVSEGVSSAVPLPSVAASLQTSTVPEKSNTASPVQNVAASPLAVNKTANASSIATTVPASAGLGTQRLPHDKVGQLEDRIKDDPKAETNAWKSLIAHYREKDQLDNARKIYWRFLDVFPSATSIWHEFAQMELEHEQMQRVEEIFQACLTPYPNVDMWNLYLDYLRRIHPLINDSDGSKRGIIVSAFEVVLDYVGIDPDSGKVWREYIEFIKGGPGTIGGTGWQDQQKMDLLRKAYQRAVKLPHSEYSKLWKEYDNFENSINRATARQNLMAQSPHYMTARGARLQLEQKLEGLDRTSISTLPPVHGCAGDDQFADQVHKYLSWISWEKDDPLVLKEDDIVEYRKRIVYVYRQATMQLRFYPEIWYDAAMWCFEQEIEEMIREGDNFLDKGTKACPESALLALTRADRMESSLDPGNNDEVVIRNGEKLDVPYESAHTALYALAKKTQERLQLAISGIKNHFASLPPEETESIGADDDEDGEGSDIVKAKTRAEQEQEQIEEAQRIHGARLNTMKRTISYVWVAKMRAFRRIQGQGAPGRPRKGFRGVFGEARPRGQLSSEVYIASALMEWHCYKDPSASKIFERGLKLFPMDEGFALEYTKFLISRNDDVNARAVFETTITKITSASNISEDKKREKCAGLLHYMHEYESAYGDIAHINRLEKRMKEMFPGETDLSRFAHRHALPNFDATEAQLVISPTQALPKPLEYVDVQQQPIPTVEQNPIGSPSEATQMRLGPNGPYVHSPKRPLEDSDNDSPQRKFLRGESPLKGAAGRRLQNLASTINVPIGQVTSMGGGGYVTKSYVPGAINPVVPSGPAPLPDKIELILSIIPRADQYRSTAFDAKRMVDLLRGLDTDSARSRFGY